MRTSAAAIICPRRVRSGAVALVLSLLALAALGAAPALAKWGPPRAINPTSGSTFDPAAVSCASTTFCAAVDFSGLASTWNGSAWSVPVSIDSSGAPVISVSCPTAGFCVAVDQAGNEITYSAGKWAAPVQIDTTHGLFHVSCASSSFCVAIDSESALVFKGGSWSAPIPLHPASFLASVSCPSSSFCMAVGGSGDAFRYNGSSWRPAPPNGVNAGQVSCSSASFCEVVGFLSTATWTGDAWSAPINVLSDPLWSFSDVSCTSSSFCMATAAFAAGINDITAGAIYRWNGKSWDSSGNNSHALNSVSCVSSSYCIAVDNHGRYMKYFVGTGARMASRRVAHSPRLRRA
ncbi:MAG TPA: hypothetical protein VKT31_12710 [Solirubrobacteraceae bacterium]|nr:hypothetical protein [Solirubrobacteraceae bacterium]